MNPISVKTTCFAALLFLLLCHPLQAQNALTNEGASIYLENSALLYVKGDLENKSTGAFSNNGIVSFTGHLVHNGSVNLNASNTGQFRLSGSGSQNISGSKSPNFYDLLLDKSAGEGRLQTGITLSHQLTFTSGSLFLNNQQVDLLNSGALVNETGVNRVYDNPTGTGTIKIVQALNAPSSRNPGNLGAIITSSQNFGSTTITRGHTQQFIVTTNSINRYYDIEPAANANLNATLRFNYFDEELNSQPESELVQWYSSLNHAVWTKRGGTVNTGSNFIDLANINSFTRVSLVSYKVIPLPLKLLSFTATRTALNESLLYWKTAEEINCSHFEVERSNDGRRWNKIGDVAAMNLAGQISSYHFTDHLPFEGVNHYRLKQVDIDGRFEYSPIRLVTYGSDGSVSIYPTVLKYTQPLFIKGISSQHALVVLYDNAGRIVFSSKLTANNISLPPLPAGTYHAKVVVSGAVVSNQQILIF